MVERFSYLLYLLNTYIFYLKNISLKNFNIANRVNSAPNENRKMLKILFPSHIITSNPTMVIIMPHNKYIFPPVVSSKYFKLIYY